MNKIGNLIKPKVVVIGSSTGGPAALETIFSKIVRPVRCPILIVQHMPPVFTEALAERLGRISSIPTSEGRDKEVLENNKIYVAPGGFHMILKEDKTGIRIVLNQDPMVHSVRPAVDLLFSSASRIFTSKCLGVVLTGMGEDGKMGAENIKGKGGAVIIQDRESSVVYGMPGAVFNAGAYDRIGNLEEITNTLNQLLAA